MRICEAPFSVQNQGLKFLNNNEQWIQYEHKENHSAQTVLLYKHCSAEFLDMDGTPLTELLEACPEIVYILSGHESGV